MVQQKLVSSEKTNNIESLNPDEPELRFPEFDNNWEKKKIKDITSLVTKGTTPKNFTNEGINFIKVENIHNNQINNINSWIDKRTHENELSRSILKKDDLLFSIAGVYIGKTAKITEDLLPANTNQALAIIRICDFNEVNVDFLHFRLNCEDIKKYIFQNLIIGAQPNLNLKQIENINISLPSYYEQLKISNLIKLIDKKIELLEKKYENTLNFKKSIFENLLNRTFSFEKSKNDWEEVKLDFILKERKEYADKKSDYPHVTLSKNGIFPKTEEYNREFLVKDENKKYKVTHLNDICYNPANLKFGVITLNKFGSAIFSPIYVTFEVKNANIEYVAYSLIRNNFINKIRKYEEGTVYERMAVKPSDFLKGTILLPPLKEQEKISNILNKLNEQLNLIEQEQNLIKSFRKGLLQKMFI